MVAWILAASLLTSASSVQSPASCDAAENPHCEEVRALAAEPAVRRAFEFIEATDERTLRDHIMLTEIAAPPFGEEPRARTYADMLREAGADSVWIDQVGNVIALRRGRTAGQTLALAGHLDTVFPEGTDVTVQQRGDTLFAPGIGDDTRGLMVVLTVLRALEAAEIETDADVLFVGTVGEEGLGDLRGVKQLFGEDGPGIDAFIAVDGGSSDDGTETITSMALGSRRYRVTFAGPGGHSWGAFGTGNPIHALGRAVHLFDEVADRYTASGARTSYNVGRIGGGTAINAVPFEAWIEVDMRSESQARLAEIDSIFRAVVQRALVEENEIIREGPPLTVDVELVGDRPSGETAADAPLLQRMVAVLRHAGLEPRLRRASTDSNVPMSLGIPAITISRGGVGDGAHSPGEWWMNRNGVAAIQRALLLVVAQAGMGDGVGISGHRSAAPSPAR